MSNLFDKIQSGSAQTQSQASSASGTTFNPDLPLYKGGNKDSRKTVLYITVGLILALAAGIGMKLAVKKSEAVESKASLVAQEQQASARADLQSLGNVTGTGIPTGPVAQPSAPDYTIETPQDRFSLATAQQLQQDLSKYNQELPPDQRNCDALNFNRTNGPERIEQDICNQEGAATYFRCTHNNGHHWDVTVPGCAR